MFFGPKPRNLALFSLFLALLGLFSVFLDPLGAKIPGMDGESPFSHGGAGRAGKGSKSTGRGKYCIYRLIDSYATPKETLICIV